MSDDVIEPEVIPPKMHPHDPRWDELRSAVRKAMPGTVAELAKSAGYDEESVKEAIAWLVGKRLAREDRDGEGRVRWVRVLSVQEIADKAGTVMDAGSAAASVVGRPDVAEVMQKGASVARKIPAAVEGIKREAKPAIEALTDLYQTAKAKGIVTQRAPYKPQIRKKRPISSSE